MQNTAGGLESMFHKGICQYFWDGFLKRISQMFFFVFFPFRKSGIFHEDLLEWTKVQNVLHVLTPPV